MCTGLWLPPRSPPVTFQTSMATALCGGQSTGSHSKPTRNHREQRRKAKDSRRRQAALLFLNNISLDGRPHCHVNRGNAEHKAAPEPPLRDRDDAVAAAVLPPDGSSPVAQVTESTLSTAAGGSSSSVPGFLGPNRPCSVTSPGLAGAASVGANEVFLEGVTAAETLAQETPVTTGHLPCSRVRSTPAALGLGPAAGGAEPRQR